MTDIVGLFSESPQPKHNPSGSIRQEELGLWPLLCSRDPDCCDALTAVPSLVKGARAGWSYSCEADRMGFRSARLVASFQVSSRPLLVQFVIPELPQLSGAPTAMRYLLPLGLGGFCPGPKRLPDSDGWDVWLGSRNWWRATDFN